jgi:glycine cleavage system aminomethyltransferase T
MTPKNLEEAIQAAGSPVELLRNSQLGPYVYPVVPPEYSSWRGEQMAWQKTCAFFNQSFHMTDMFIEGPGALKLLSDFGINSFKNFSVDKAKQYVPCSPDGYVIGDVILFHLEENLFNGRAG